MTKQEQTILKLVRLARKKLEAERLATSESLKGVVISTGYFYHEFHIVKGRQIFTKNVVNRDFSDHYIESSITLNIDGVPFKFFWLINLN